MPEDFIIYPDETINHDIAIDVDETKFSIRQDSIGIELQPDKKDLTINDDRNPISVIIEPSPNITISHSDAPPGAQGPPGTGGSGGGAVLFNAVNKDSITLVKGTPVTKDVSGTGYVRADASSINKDAFGVVNADVSSNAAGDILLTGPITLADWTAITGTVNLAPNAKYFLDGTAGKLTTNPNNGIFNQYIGITLSPTTMDINISKRLL